MQRFAMLALCASLALACRGDGGRADATAERPAAAARPEEAQRLLAFFERSFDAHLARHPMERNAIGDMADNDRWDDVSDAAARAEIEAVQRDLGTLRAEFDPRLLDDESQLAYRLFEWECERKIEQFRWRMQRYPVTQMRGLHTQVPSFLANVHRIEDVADARAYVARLEGVDALFSQVVDNLLLRERMGVLPPRFVFPLVLDSCRNVLRGAPFTQDGGDCSLLADFRGKIAALALDAPREAELIAAAETALLESVRPAYLRLIEALERQEQSATDDDGAWKLPDGHAYYDHALRHATTTKWTAREIHQLGLDEVARIHDEMRAILARIGFEGGLDDAFRMLRDDERFYFSNDEEGRAAYLERATAILDGMDARLDEIVGTRPRAALRVRAIEPFRARAAGKAFYEPGSADGRRPGTYYVNLHDMRAMPTYQLEALAFHEGVPGHHLQIATARELEGLPRFRRFARCTAYTEGWGLYSEYLPKEMGFYDDPYSDLGRLAMELWRACRLVVDTGIHRIRWSRRRAIDYLLENTPNPEPDCEKAVLRYVVMPGQATAYTVGMKTILELRERAAERLGPRFDLRAFHDALLRSGPMPLSLLDARLEDWARAVEDPGPELSQQR